MQPIHQNSQQFRVPELERLDKQKSAIGYLELGNPDWLGRWHFHDEYELHYVVASSGKVFIGDYIGRFQPGELYLTGPRVPHNWINNSGRCSSSDWPDGMVHFDHELIAGISDLAPELKEIMPMLARARYGIRFREIDAVIAARFENLRDSSAVQRFGEFCQLMHELSIRKDYQLLSTSQLDSCLNRHRQDHLNKVVDYLMARYPDAISLAQAAELIGMSESAFSRFFRKSTGRGFSNFLNSIRIGEACELLVQTDQSIAKICFEVGFRNIANFNRRFRAHKGVSPSEYRRQTTSGHYFDDAHPNFPVSLSHS